MKYLKTVFFTLTFSLMISHAFAWGQIGHYLIGYMAEKQMKKIDFKKSGKSAHPNVTWKKWDLDGRDSV